MNCADINLSGFARWPVEPKAWAKAFVAKAILAEFEAPLEEFEAFKGTSREIATWRVVCKHLQTLKAPSELDVGGTFFLAAIDAEQRLSNAWDKFKEQPALKQPSSGWISDAASLMVVLDALRFQNLIGRFNSEEEQSSQAQDDARLEQEFLIALQAWREESAKVFRASLANPDLDSEWRRRRLNIAILMNEAERLQGRAKIPKNSDDLRTEVVRQILKSTLVEWSQHGVQGSEVETLSTMVRGLRVLQPATQFCFDELRVLHNAPQRMKESERKRMRLPRDVQAYSAMLRMLV